MKKTNSVLFDLTDDALIVANTGRGFSRKGVISICSMDLSEKDAHQNRTPVDVHSEKNNRELVCAISEMHLAGYRNNINQLSVDANREKGVRKSYAGRFMWELLQNADDAADMENINAHLIGTKGLGFKSVLEITDEPEIYSGEFCFHFSRTKSRKMLEKVPMWDINKGIPVCKLPHPIKPDAMVKKLFSEGYKTVIRLPLKKGKTEIIKRKLSEFCGYSLLFCQHLKSVEIRENSETNRITVHRPSNGLVELTENGNSASWRVWRKTREVDGEKQLSVGVCLPVAEGKVESCKEVPPLSVFFPTSERIPGVHALVHASCEVEDNRKHLGGEQPHQKEICGILKKIIKEILPAIPPRAALHAFGRAEESTGDADNEMLSRLSSAVVEAVRETAFIPVIGGGKVKPGDVRPWKYGLGRVLNPEKVKDENLCIPEINNEEIWEALAWDEQNISDEEHASLLRHCRNATAKNCLDVWKVAQSLMGKTPDKEECAKLLRKALFWWINGGRARAISGEIPLVWKKPKDCPDWLAVEVVDKGFSKRIEDEKQQRKKEDENWKDALSGEVSPLASTAEYFDNILLPYCKDQSPDWWQQNGWKILKMAEIWGNKDGRNEPLILDSDSPMEQRARIFHLPVGKGANEWRPAWQCYAGKAWGGPQIFDRYFSDIPNRYLLSPIDDWKIAIADSGREQWEKLLPWLGCSWIPKMVRQNKPHSQRDDVYCTYWISEFYFEHFDEILSKAQEGERSGLGLLSKTTEMYAAAENNKASYFYYTNNERDSYALIQLRQQLWVPCKKSLLYPGRHLFSPEKSYLPGCGLGGLLPEINKPSMDKESWRDIEKTLKNLGASAGISDDADKLIEYMWQLSDCAKKKDANLKWGKDEAKSPIARAAKQIFSDYAKIQSAPVLEDELTIPCLKYTKEGEILYFKEAENVYWADEPYFNEPEVRRIILKDEGLDVFFLFLKDGGSFGLKKLSEFLEMEPVHGNELPETSDLDKRYQERRIGLNKATGKKLPEKLEITAYEKITLKTDKPVDITPEIRFWKQSDCKVDINIGGENDMWRGLAAALGAVGGCDEYKSDFELLLQEKERDNFMRRLQDDYNLTEESLEEVKELIPPENNDSGTANREEEADQSAGPDHTEEGTPVHPGDRFHRSHPGRSGGAIGDTSPGRDSSKGKSYPRQSRAIPDLEVVENYQWPPAGTSSGRTGGGYGATSDDLEEGKDSGMRGEQVLLQWLQNRYGHNNVHDMNEEHPNNPGYDILVTKNGEEHYYECKSTNKRTPPRKVSLTAPQHEKAECAKDRYWLCVIYDMDAEKPKLLNGPISNPAGRLKKKPIITEYKLDLTSLQAAT